MHRRALAGGLALWLFGAACAGGGDGASGGPARASAGEPITVGLRSFLEVKRHWRTRRWLW